MDQSPHLLAGRDQRVTASDLVRQFGLWQERAARAPVYVLHRGRPRLVLASVEVMDALCAPHAGDDGTERARLTALLAAEGGIVFVTDRDGVIQAASRGAVQRFGGAAAAGRTVASLTAVACELVADAFARVRGGGTAESVDASWSLYPDRRVTLDIAPLPDGCIVSAYDATAADERAGTARSHAALAAATEAAGVIGVDVSLRGHLVDPPATLAQLTGVSAEALATARLTALVDVGDRVALGDAIEQAAHARAGVAVPVRLLVRGAEPLPARIGIAAVIERAQATAFRAIIAPHLRAA